MKLDPTIVVAIVASAGTIAVGAITGIVAWLVRREGKGVDSASVHKTEAETVAREVQTARELLGEVRSYFEARDKDRQSDIAALTAEIEELRKRVVSVETQQQTMRQQMAVHRAWDEAAWAQLRAIAADYPPPPPVDGL